MQTECSTERSVFGRVEGRSVVAEFDGGALTSELGRPAYWALPTNVWTWFAGLRDVSATRETRGSSSTQSPRSSGSACSALRSATRI